MASLPASRSESLGRGLPLPVCKSDCGSTLTLCRADGAYPGLYTSVNCDECGSRVSGSSLCYHCPFDKAAPHTGGWDLCSVCGFKQITSQARSPRCTCGETCTLIGAQSAYAEHRWIWCNLCRRRSEGTEPVWHCGKGKRCPRNSFGFDMCAECGLSTTMGVDCVCGGALTLLHFTSMYHGTGAGCDICDGFIRKNEPSLPTVGEYAFHCPRGRSTAAHSSGYDVCLKCAYKASLKKLLRSRSLGGSSAAAAGGRSSSSSAMKKTKDASVNLRLALRTLGLFEKYYAKFEEEEIDDDTLEHLTNDQVSALFGGKMGPSIKFQKWLQSYRMSKSEDKSKKCTSEEGSEGEGRSTDSGLCCVCMDSTAECTTVPCGHLCVCSDCATHIKADRTCPICRTSISDVIKVFASGHAAH